nr:hypothetical protein Iba_chr10fCG5530 [Ipomoea batatas]
MKQCNSSRPGKTPKLFHQVSSEATGIQSWLHISLLSQKLNNQHYNAKQSIADSKLSRTSSSVVSVKMSAFAIEHLDLKLSTLQLRSGSIPTAENLWARARGSGFPSSNCFELELETSSVSSTGAEFRTGAGNHSGTGFRRTGAEIPHRCGNLTSSGFLGNQNW